MSTCVACDEPLAVDKPPAGERKERLAAAHLGCVTAPEPLIAHMDLPGDLTLAQCIRLANGVRRDIEEMLEDLGVVPDAQVWREGSHQLKVWLPAELSREQYALLVHALWPKVVMRTGLMGAQEEFRMHHDPRVRAGWLDKHWAEMTEGTSWSGRGLYRAKKVP